MKIKISKEKVIYTLLAAFAVSLFNFAGQILAVLLVLFVFFYLNGKISMDSEFVSLIAFSLFYFITYLLFWSAGIKEIITYLIAPWGCYLIGRDIVRYSKDRRVFQKVILILVIGFWLHGMLNLLTCIQKQGLANMLSSPFRITYDFWRQSLISVTGCSFYYIPAIALPIGYLFFGKGKKGMILSWIGLITSLLANYLYANRTAFYIAAILVVLCYLLVLSSRKVSLGHWIMLAVITAAAILVWSLDIYGIRTAIMGSKLAKRVSGDEVGRISVWIKFLKSDWWMHPFGGEKVGDGFAHNLWLDTLRTAGIVPFLSLIVFSVLTVFQFFRFCKKAGNAALPYFIMLAGICLSFLVEPVIEANPYYFLVAIMMIGCIKGWCVSAAPKEI